MNIDRGYHSMTTLDDGSVFTVGGSWSGGRGGKDGEIWRDGEGLRLLPDVPADQMLTDDPEGVYRSDNHMWLFQAPNKRIFQAGPSRTKHWIDVEGDGSVTSGEVVVIGGMATANIFSDEGAVLPAEIWNPETDTWRQLAAMQVPRTYHSFGLLMKDGRVLAGGGGGLCGNCGVNHDDVEIFTPPYLLNADGSSAIRP